MAKKSMLYAGTTIVAIIFMLSCRNQRAKLFLDTIDQQERVATDIVIGEKGTESQKLEHMIKNNFDSALSVNERQQAEFDMIIHTISSLKPERIEGGKALQTASIAYYEALKNLYGYTRAEIEQQKTLVKASGDQQIKAQDSLMDLTRAKQQLFQRVYRADSILSSTKEQFSQQHNLGAH